MPVDQVSVALPVGIGFTGPQVGDFIETSPGFRRHWNESGTRSPGDGNGDLFACLGSAHQLGGLLSKFP